MPKLKFDDWYALISLSFSSSNEESINIQLAESGADKEMDFDSELEFEKRYQEYCDKPE